MLRKARAAGNVLIRPVGVGFAVGEKGSGPWRVWWARVREERCMGLEVAEELKEVGESRKLSDQDLVDAEGGVGEPLEKSWVMRLAARGRVVGFGGRRKGSMGSKETEGRVRSSRTSLMVNAACETWKSVWAVLGCIERERDRACMGPLLPTTRTLFTRLLESASRAYSVMSVFLKTSMSVNRVRATSSATFPCPMITASSPASNSGARSAYSGNPLYQPTNARAE